MTLKFYKFFFFTYIFTLNINLFKFINIYKYSVILFINKNLYKYIIKKKMAQNKQEKKPKN